MSSASTIATQSTSLLTLSEREKRDEDKTQIDIPAIDEDFREESIRYFKQLEDEKYEAMERNPEIQMKYGFRFTRHHTRQCEADTVLAETFPWCFKRGITMAYEYNNESHNYYEYWPTLAHAFKRIESINIAHCRSYYLVQKNENTQLVFDLDLDFEKLNGRTKEGFYQLAYGIINRVCGLFNVDPGQVAICPTENPHKFSIHLIFPIMFPTYHHCKELANAIKAEAVKWDEVLGQAIDVSIYSQNRVFRCLGCNKRKHTKAALESLCRFETPVHCVKYLLNKDVCKNTPVTEEEMKILENPELVNKFREFKTVSGWGCTLKEFALATPIRRSIGTPIESDNWIINLVYMRFRTRANGSVYKHRQTKKLQDEKGTPTSIRHDFSREESEWCEICNRDHGDESGKGDGAYTYTNLKTGQTRFFCRRDEGYVVKDKDGKQKRIFRSIDLGVNLAIPKQIEEKIVDDKKGEEKKGPELKQVVHEEQKQNIRVERKEVKKKLNRNYATYGEMTVKQQQKFRARIMKESYLTACMMKARDEDFGAVIAASLEKDLFIDRNDMTREHFYVWDNDERLWHFTRDNSIAKFFKKIVDKRFEIVRRILWSMLEEQERNTRSIVVSSQEQLNIQQRHLQSISNAKAYYQEHLHLTYIPSDLVVSVRGYLSREHVVMNEQPLVFPVKPGMLVDLTTGEMRRRKRTDMFTAEADGRYESKLYYKNITVFNYLNHLFGSSEKIATWNQRIIGTGLLGLNHQRIFAEWYGNTASGKSTFARAIERILGPTFANTIKTELVSSATKKPKEGEAEKPTSFLHSLEGLRYAFAHENMDSAYFNEALVKKITGMDKIASRKMQKDATTFTFPGLLCVIGNFHHSHSGHASIVDRHYMCYHPSSFSSEYNVPDHKNKLYPEVSLAEHAKMMDDEECRSAILAFLIDGAVMSFTTPKKSWKMPDEIKGLYDDAKREKEEKEPVEGFLSDFVYDPLVVPDKRIAPETLWNEFTLYRLTHHPSSQNVPRSQSAFSSKAKTYFINTIKGLKEHDLRTPYNGKYLWRIRRKTKDEKQIEQKTVTSKENENQPDIDPLEIAG